MNEDKLNLSIRKFLKQVGVTSQREIENAVRDADTDALPPSVEISVQLNCPALGITHTVDGTLETK
ncbi:MAG: DUF6494 family protein [Wenzhouxiangellaceae bacterium]|nr:DUF6494 family protein [Wenzhouxiangellaceae bacterium]